MTDFKEELPTSSSSYIIIDCHALGKAKSDEELLDCVYGGGTIYRRTAARRMADHRVGKFKDERFAMLLVRTWTINQQLPSYAFNVGMAGFVDEFLIHEHQDKFNERFCTKPGFGHGAAFLNDHAKFFLNDKRKNEMLDLIFDALQAFEYVDEKVFYYFKLFKTNF